MRISITPAAFAAITPAALAAMILVGCGGGGEGGTPPQTVRTPASISVEVSSPDVLVSLGDTRAFTAVVRDSVNATIDDATVTWATNAPGVAQLSPATGLSTTATAFSNGGATITATSGSVSASKSITVTQKFASVGLTPGAFSVVAGNGRPLSATARDARGNLIDGATGFGFSSNNEAAATVHPATGFVSGVAPGSATITASLTRDQVTASATSIATVTPASTFPTTATVNMPGSAFTPDLVDIQANGTVTWVFGPTDHNVNFDVVTGRPANIPTTTNASVARTFATPGTFTYLCNIHAGMTGTVVVH